MVSNGVKWDRKVSFLILRTSMDSHFPVTGIITRAEAEQYQ